ncbi:MAG: GSCFA domain-containing protein, partial [Bacteroidota bacterium]
MKLQTKITLLAEQHQIDYKSRLVLLGSCFTTHIGKKLDYYKFPLFQNPLGILFHPVAIENVIVRACKQEEVTEEALGF